MKVAIDLTPLLGPRTGIGRVVEEVAARVGSYAGIEPTGLLLSLRGRPAFEAAVRSVAGPDWSLRRIMTPARLSHQLWRRTDWPELAGFDVVHGLNYVVPPARSGAELVAVHDLTAWKYPDLVDEHSRHNPELLRRAIARGAHVHTGSRFVAEEIIDELGVPSDRVHTILNGHTPGLAGDERAGRLLVDDMPFILAIGTIEPRKDYVGLIAAMDSVWKEKPEVQLVIVGQSGWGADAVDAAIERCRKPANIRRVGYVSESDKANLLAAAEALVYPSLYEGFGFPLLEAMEAGVPIVSTTAGSIPEVVGDAACLVSPRNTEELANAIVATLDDEAQAEDRVERGRRRLSLFSWQVMVDELVGLYGQLAGLQSVDNTL